MGGAGLSHSHGVLYGWVREEEVTFGKWWEFWGLGVLLRKYLALQDSYPEQSSASAEGSLVWGQKALLGLLLGEKGLQGP